MAKTSIWAPCIKLGATEGCLIQKTRIWKALHWLFIALKTGSNTPGLTLRDKPLVLSLSLFPIALFLLCLSPRDTKASSIKASWFHRWCFLCQECHSLSCFPGWMPVYFSFPLFSSHLEVVFLLCAQPPNPACSSVTHVPCSDLQGLYLRPILGGD